MFTVFDRDALIAGLKDHIDQSSFVRIGDNIHKDDSGLNYAPITIDEWDKAMSDSVRNVIKGGQAASRSADSITRNIALETNIVYADEIPPFDITISFANEYGQKARLVIYAVELLNEASGFSIDNVTSEKACTFVARRVEYMRPVGEGTTDAQAQAGTGTNKDSMNV